MHVNLSPFREVNLFHRKMPTVPALEISWNFNIFSKFTNFHQTCRTYWNHHQKHACEIWAYSEKLTCFIEKYPQKHACEIWVFSEKLNIFIEKCLQCQPALEISWNFNIFSKFTKFHQTCIIYWNHNQKLAFEILAHSDKLNFFIEKCLQCRP